LVVVDLELDFLLLLQTSLKLFILFFYPVLVLLGLFALLELHQVNLVPLALLLDLGDFPEDKLDVVVQALGFLQNSSNLVAGDLLVFLVPLFLVRLCQLGAS